MLTIHLYGCIIISEGRKEMTRKELRKKRKIKKLRQFLEILILIIGVLANIVTILEFFGIKP